LYKYTRTVIYANALKIGIYMTKPITKYQKKVLRSLALNGKQNIQAIQLKENLNYATTHRSIKALEKLDLIWMSNRDIARGPKGAKEYSLTPYGVVESGLRCVSEDEIDLLNQNWNVIAPRYIQFWRGLCDVGLKDYIYKTLQDIYPERVAPYRSTEADGKAIKIIIHSEKSNTVYRNILDMIMVDEICNSSRQNLDKITDFVDFVKKHPDYKKIIDKWLSVKKFKFQYLISLIE